MAAVHTTVDDCTRWIEQQQRVHDSENLSCNKQAVLEQLAEQQTRCHQINNCYNQQDFADNGKLSDDQLDALRDLKLTAERRLSCLRSLSEINDLDHVFGPLVNEFSQKAVDLVAKTDKQPACITGNSSQSCILGVRSNWSWIVKQLKCTETHLQNAAEYHQFFYEVSQYEQWMLRDLSKTTSLLDKQTICRNSHGQVATQLLLEMKAAIATFVQWSKKVDALCERSRKVVPVAQRTHKLDTHLPVKALCSYSTKQITIQEGEELTLLDNSGAHLWQVRNERAQIAEVPAVMLLIPGPDVTAVQTALQLRLQLLAVWTVEWKRIGKTIIWFLLQVIRQWTPDELKMLQALCDADKSDLVAMLDDIDKTFAIYWQRYQPYQTLEARSLALRDVIRQKPNNTDKETEFGQLLVIQTAIVIELLARYRDYWQYWEVFKILTETTRHPEYLLVVENWKEYNFIDIAQWLKKWQLETMDDLDLVDTEVCETVEKTEVERLEYEKCLMEREKVTAETSHLTTTELEERQTFVITGVTDPRTGAEIAFDEAVSLGIINQRDGQYVNIATGESQPIQMAMNAGKIKVELTTVKKSAEKRKDIGLVTIKTCKESRPFTVKSVVDAQTEKKLTVEEAIKAGILDLKKGLYTNKITHEALTLADALDSGLLMVEFDDDSSNGKNSENEEDVETKTYAVHGVENLKLKKRLTFKEAIDSAILDMDNGSYLNTATGEYLYVGDAIKKGFIKATVIHNVQSLDATSRIVAVADTAIAMSSFKRMSQPLMAMKALKTENGQ